MTSGLVLVAALLCCAAIVHSADSAGIWELMIKALYFVQFFACPIGAAIQIVRWMGRYGKKAVGRSVALGLMQLTAWCASMQVMLSGDCIAEILLAQQGITMVSGFRAAAFPQVVFATILINALPTIVLGAGLGVQNRPR